MSRLRVSTLALALGLGFGGPAGAVTMGDPDVAALQVGLHRRDLYAGPIDGLLGPRTEVAVRRFQRLSGLPTSGWAGPRTRASLGRYAEAQLGERLLEHGAEGWDVAELQFLLAWHGFPSGRLDGSFGERVEAALTAFQTWAGVPATGVAGPLALAALAAPLPRCPLALSWPLALPVGDEFGPRGAAFHPGIDIPAERGAAVAAAAPGVVIEARSAGDGYGRRVVVDHGGGVTTISAHLSRLAVAAGDEVEPGDVVGYVGASGEATGPHLHFEVRVRGAAVDPLPALRRDGTPRPSVGGGPEELK
jgi:peptidoglycan hydrolase-like protein with peptidoglycan-binding domain